MLSSDELADLQADMEDIALDGTADLQRNMSSTFVLGQKTEDWQSILPDGVPVSAGMTAPSKALAQQYASQIGTQQAAVFSFPTIMTTEPALGDRVIWKGQTWTVQANLSEGSYPILTPVLATRIS